MRTSSTTSDHSMSAKSSLLSWNSPSSTCCAKTPSFVRSVSTGFLGPQSLISICSHLLFRHRAPVGQSEFVEHWLSKRQVLAQSQPAGLHEHCVLPAESG